MITDDFMNAGWNGKDDNHPGLRRLMTSYRNGDISTVVVCKIDRLMRNARLLLGCVDEFKKIGIRFVAIDDNIDTGESKTGQLMLTILAAVAEWERERLGLVFTGGTIGKDAYKGKLQRFRKQEKELLKIKNNLSPEARLEIAELENSIRGIEDILDRSSRNIRITNFGIFGTKCDRLAPLGYNLWSETKDKNEIG